jgi:hypothetical protein
MSKPAIQKSAAKKAKAKKAVTHSNALAKNTTALDLHSKALAVHTKSLLAAAAVTHSLNRDGVRKILAEMWGVEKPSDVKDAEPLTDYITGGPAAILDFCCNTLKSRFPSLQLTPAKLNGVNTVGSLITVILKNL